MFWNELATPDVQSIQGLGSIGQRKAHPPKDNPEKQVSLCGRSGRRGADSVRMTDARISRGMPDVEEAHVEAGREKRAWPVGSGRRIAGAASKPIRTSSTLDDPATAQLGKPGQRGW